MLAAHLLCSCGGDGLGGSRCHRGRVALKLLRVMLLRHALDVLWMMHLPPPELHRMVVVVRHLIVPIDTHV